MNRSFWCRAGSKLSLLASLPAGRGLFCPPRIGQGSSFSGEKFTDVASRIAYFSGPRRVARWVHPTGRVGGDDPSRIEMLYGCIWNGVRSVDSAPLIPLTCSLFTPRHQHHQQPAEAPTACGGRQAEHLPPFLAPQRHALVQNCNSRSKMADTRRCSCGEACCVPISWG